MIYSIRHVTHFSYEPAVRESVTEVRVQPRSETLQRCLTFSLDCNPNANIMVYRDFLGNTVHHFDIPGLHTELKIAAQAVVEVIPPPIPLPSDVGSWEDLDARIAEGDFLDVLLPSQFARSTQLLEELAGELHLERRGNPMELLLQINEAMYETFRYVPNSTQVDSPIDDALRTRQGVCQDLTHIMISLLRYLRIPSRYVSGYLFRAKQDHDRSPEGATHAWLEAYLPGPGWVAFDPTNKLIGSERHIRVAVGRDYADVPPTRGVYKGEAESELSVTVVVAPAEAPLPEEMPPATVTRSRPLFTAMHTFHYDQSQQQQ